MTAPTDQFVDIAKRSQEAVTTAVRSWADTVQSFAGNLNAGQAQLPDPQSVVDTYFDFAEKLLANQRQLATEFVNASVKAGESVQEQVSKVTEQVTTQTVNGATTAAEQATAATETVAAKAATTARAARNVAKS
jgi:predicted RecB family nuclease